jgi:hypothetical protein
VGEREVDALLAFTSVDDGSEAAPPLAVHMQVREPVLSSASDSTMPRLRLVYALLATPACSPCACCTSLLATRTRSRSRRF